MTESAPTPSDPTAGGSGLDNSSGTDLGGSQADGLGAALGGVPPQASASSSTPDNIDASADDSADDPWAAAMAEQAAATPAPPPTAPSAAAPEAAPPAKAVAFPSLDPSGGGGESDLSFIKDIPVQLTVELGRTHMTIKNLLQLGQGSVVELDGLAGEPMDIFVNGFLIAQGEVVVVEDRYGIRLTDIVTPADRLNRLNGRR